MSTLRIAGFTMPSAGLRDPSPLPPLKPYINASTAGFDDEYALPYYPQDDYDRNRKPQTHKVAILENDRLRATFLLDLGGRLWSLYHKPTETELLTVNPVFQPANLAIRNAWFSGGVEWNIAKLGHSVFTCSPVHAAQVAGPSGEPVLRIYEFERSRAVPFQVDFYLPDGSDFLFASPTIWNPNDQPVKMYWWSNIAVPQKEKTRVLGPADTAVGHNYTDAGQRETAEISDEYYTYPTNRKHAADMYFNIPDGQRPWVSAVDENGSGLLHVSSPRLYGRKMFVWGVEVGGQRWQEFLSQPGEAYIEIQGGLSRVQGEYIDMPAGAAWNWTEAYGPMQIEPETAHGNWKKAYTTADAYSEKVLPKSRFEEVESLLGDISQKQYQEFLHSGSPWGYLDQKIQKLDNTKPNKLEEDRYPASTVDGEAIQWLHLIQAGYLPERAVTDVPGECVCGTHWLRLLKSSTASSLGNHWLTWYHIGVAEVAQKDDRAAVEAFHKSIELAPNGWSYRALAVLAEKNIGIDEACQLMTNAIALLPDLKCLFIEASVMFINNRRIEELNDLAERIPESLRLVPRMRLTLAYSALYQGQLEDAESFFNEPIELTDIREGEDSITDLWFETQAAKLAKQEGVPVSAQHQEKARAEIPPPPGFDFRMHE